MSFYRRISKIQGWLSFVDFRIFKNIIEFQNSINRTSQLCEIGVHHGKSFIPMLKFSGESVCHCIDIFDEQSLNIDSSGKGDFNIFWNNIKKFKVSRDRVRIHKKLSTLMTKENLCEDGESFRFFHIDGGHNLEVVKSDIDLGLKCSDRYSVIVIDDVCRSEWIQVSKGVFESSSVFKEYGFIILAFGFNKLYFCHESMLEVYQEALNRDNILNTFLEKIYKVKSTSSSQIPIYSSIPLPEWRIAKFAIHFIKLKFPFLYIKIHGPIKVCLKIIKKLKLIK